MRDDLLDAQAAVNWAGTQTGAFDQRIKAWTGVNVNIRIEDTLAPATHDRVIALLREPLPRAFNVEFGVCINTIRSSLDILAVVLARRHGILNIKQVQFPVARSQADFNYKGGAFVSQLLKIERAKIEALNPYDGGNADLWALHNLDIERKHRRLIDISARPVGFTRDSTFADFTPNTNLSDWTLKENQETVIEFLRKGSDDDYIKFFPVVACTEPGVARRIPVLAAILHFVETANRIIALFDY